MSGSFPVSEQYVEWFKTEARGRKQAEETARRLASDFLVFVSYSWADEAVAHDVTDALDRRQIRYVQDRKDVAWGDRISQWAQEEIRRSTHYLLILTKSSAASGWCAYEFGVAVGAEKVMLVFIADPELDILPFAAGHAAVRELRDVEGFFAEARIDEHEVARFIEELLEVKLSELAEFVPRVNGDQAAWDAPIRDDSETEDRWRLLGIELDSERQQLALEYGYRPRPEYPTKRHEVSYEPQRTAVVTTPKKGTARRSGCLTRARTRELAYGLGAGAWRIS